MTGILRKREIRTRACPQGERHGKMRAETRAMQPRNTKDCQQTARSQERGMEAILVALGRNQARRHQGLRRPASRVVRQHISVA